MDNSAISLFDSPMPSNADPVFARFDALWELPESHSSSLWLSNAFKLFRDCPRAERSWAANDIGGGLTHSDHITGDIYYTIKPGPRTTGGYCLVALMEPMEGERSHWVNPAGSDLFTFAEDLAEGLVRKALNEEDFKETYGDCHPDSESIIVLDLGICSVYCSPIEPYANCAHLWRTVVLLLNPLDLPPSFVNEIFKDLGHIFEGPRHDPNAKIFKELGMDPCKYNFWVENDLKPKHYNFETWSFRSGNVELQLRAAPIWMLYPYEMYGPTGAYSLPLFDYRLDSDLSVEGLPWQPMPFNKSFYERPHILSLCFREMILLFDSLRIEQLQVLAVIKKRLGLGDKGKAAMAMKYYLQGYLRRRDKVRKVIFFDSLVRTLVKGRAPSVEERIYRYLYVVSE
ncbi:hypothetical protein BJ508DRAFT_11531 [Ascobolus immersus RN42]|uniref:Uncharacterized protein n=1 Tax=Ascobolus immersus RN42 TaxID=1160509 RepID=A0A3N4HQC0_ASCIM|nr:hypothetical protein BJ508DRAFT_11531 [Ascobolus immersus RN42]